MSVFSNVWGVRAAVIPVAFLFAAGCQGRSPTGAESAHLSTPENESKDEKLAERDESGEAKPTEPRVEEDPACTQAQEDLAQCQAPCEALYLAIRECIEAGLSDCAAEREAAEACNLGCEPFAERVRVACIPEPICEDQSVCELLRVAFEVCVAQVPCNEARPDPNEPPQGEGEVLIVERGDGDEGEGEEREEHRHHHPDPAPDRCGAIFETMIRVCAEEVAPEPRPEPDPDPRDERNEDPDADPLRGK